VDDVKSDGAGVVWSYTVVNRSRLSGFADRTPYVVVVVTLHEGVQVISNLVNAEDREIAIGMEVKLAFLEVADGWMIPVFELV
jgi:hypothetical protein